MTEYGTLGSEDIVPIDESYAHRSPAATYQGLTVLHGPVIADHTEQKEHGIIIIVPLRRPFILPRILTPISSLAPAQTNLSPLSRYMAVDAVGNTAA
jgi:hypothetical protein